MCRNIKVLANFEPPASDDEVRAAALQFVRKISGSTRPSRANEAAFDAAVEEVTASARRLLDSMETKAPPRDRETEARKARARSAKRFSRPGQRASAATS
ncbi:DUF2277 domain-containing protein [Longimicrobium sp.]|uniref:DUF2277 domain-containing protein n=1 Tax=Longimicrobium sp. TaxID=2029185 RepID=UPI003B3AFD7C